ncbi:MAG: hypothetical protein JSS07_08330 [Proteobacteria bacterium]|nr:hypothetical protein [Pseudomonadota bacterium]
MFAKSAVIASAFYFSLVIGVVATGVLASYTAYLWYQHSENSGKRKVKL